MAGIVVANGVAASAEALVDTQGSQRISPYHPNIGSNGAYRLSAQSGLLTGVAAATAAAGHLFAFRWSHATKLALITHIRARWFTIAGFTAAQEVGLDMVITRSYSASHTGGTALSLTGDAFKKRSTFAATNVADIRISTTGALTNGTHTVDSTGFAYGGFSELALGATVPKGLFECEFSIQDLAMHPLVLSQNTGFLIRNNVLMGAGGTARLSVDLGWMEVDSY